ncbi:MAG: hypothetical protein OXC64_03185 [Flavobacteriaceae bacterium]|nr:hypothetical protein [Flavobacteriaceae bacterium]
MSFITEPQLSNFSRLAKTFTKDDTINLRKSYSRDKTKPMFFLSHEHEKYSILRNVISFLQVEGVYIYVDCMDKEMAKYTNAETAIRLKEKIKISDKFILVTIGNAVNSKWGDWELGSGDAIKYIEYITLLPINRANQSYKGIEYLNTSIPT